MARQMTIGKKITLGFALVILALTALAGWSVYGVSGIVGNASEVIDGNKLRAEMTQREVDHLNWANAVNELLTDEKVTELNVEVDPTRCGFGKWYYSDARKQAESLVPSIREPMQQIEKWHNQLHASAEEIKGRFCQADVTLSGHLERCKGDHLGWLSHIRQQLLDKDATIATEAVDPHRCRFGKWYYSDEARAFRQANPAFDEIMARIEGPHKKLHESAKDINALLADNRRPEAVSVMQAQTTSLAAEVCGLLDEAIAWNDKQVAGMSQAQNLYATRTKPALEHVQEYLDATREQVARNVMTDQEMLDEAGKTRAGVIL
ncbi:MAG: CZB domain-containing protein, partial [Planctomycetota bacterium]